MKTQLEQKRTARLRAAISSFANVEVDESAGVIRNASVMTVGPAAGHGFEIDTTSLSQLVAAIAARGGEVKVRFKHPAMDPTGAQADDLGTDVGVIRNIRLEGDRVRGDVHLREYAKSLPVYGDVRTYLLKKAVEAPDSFGLSAVIEYQLERIGEGADSRIVARIVDADAVDFVGTPAANPAGLLSANPARPSKPAQLQETTVDPAFIEFLKGKLGLAPESTPEQVEAAYAALPDDQKAACTAEFEAAKSAAMSAEEDEKKGEGVPPAQMAVRRPAAGTPDIIALERRRVTDIQALGTILPGIPKEEINKAIALGFNLEQARGAFLAHLAANTKPIAAIRVGEDRARTTLRDAIPDAIRIRAGLTLKNASDQARRLAGLSLCDMTREYLITHGVADARYFSRAQLAELITSARKRAALAQSTSDFDNVLLDAANKTLRAAYAEYPVTWPVWCKRTTNPDFKAGNRILLSEVGTPTSRTEGAPITYNTLTDSKETVTLTEYATGIRLTRRAIVNDDLDAFNRIPTQMGLAFKRLEDNLAYDILTSNPTLSDTGALFNSTAVTTTGGHANTSAAGAPTVATIQTVSALMRKQKGYKGDAYLDLRPKALIVPVTLEVTAAQVVGSSVDPAKSNAAINPYFNALTVVSHPRLDASSTSYWYLAADPNMIDTVEVCFLSDEPEPVLKNETEFDTDDVKFAGRHTLVAKAIDFRGLARNTG